MPSINKIPSMVKSNVALASYLVEDTFGSVRSICKNIVAHYYLSASTQVKHMCCRRYVVLVVFVADFDAPAALVHVFFFLRRRVCMLVSAFAT